jgi:hypothetical protein
VVKGSREGRVDGFYISRASFIIPSHHFLIPAQAGIYPLKDALAEYTLIHPPCRLPPETVDSPLQGNDKKYVILRTTKIKLSF